jgi:hypothetical protein
VAGIARVRESREERWRSEEIQDETSWKDWEFPHEDSLRERKSSGSSRSSSLAE